MLTTGITYVQLQWRDGVVHAVCSSGMLTGGDKNGIVVIKAAENVERYAEAIYKNVPQFHQ